METGAGAKAAAEPARREMAAKDFMVDVNKIEVIVGLVEGGATLKNKVGISGHMNFYER